MSQLARGWIAGAYGHLNAEACCGLNTELWSDAEILGKTFAEAVERIQILVPEGTSRIRITRK